MDFTRICTEDNFVFDQETLERVCTVMKLTEEEFDKKATEYGEEVAKQEMIIYVLAEKEGIEVTEEEYNEYLDSILAGSGFKSEDDFKAREVARSYQHPEKGDEKKCGDRSDGF